MKKITLALALASIFTLTLIDANAQRFGKTPQDSIECLMNNSLYKEFYKQKAYKLKPLRLRVCTLCFCGFSALIRPDLCST